MSQVKSKQRVSDHGEVFTSEREVNAMLDLVNQETERIDSRFLEPACGTGNFLTEILRRKLDAVVSKYKKSQIEFERNCFIAVSSIYGIDLLEDNVFEARERLFSQIQNNYESCFKKSTKEEFSETIKFLLSKNILIGDALSMLKPDGTPIVFPEWTMAIESKVKRRDYTLDNLMKNRPMESPNLFSDLGEEAFIPVVQKEFPLCHYLNIIEND